MDDWGSHFPALANCVINTTGPVLELGAGDYSTPLLHFICKSRGLVSLDNDPNWLGRYLDLRSNRHIVELIQDWDSCHWIDEHWDVVFVDHAPGERRIIDIARLKDNCKYIVVHDSQSPAYLYENVFPLFRYQYVYKRFKTETTILSQYVDPSIIFK